MSEDIWPQGRIGVFLLDDHEIFRRDIRALLDSEPDIDLDSEPDIDVVGEAETAAAALARMPAPRAGGGLRRAACR